jgi:hypothetical protein
MLLLLFLSVVTAQTVVLWRMTSYSGTVFGCGGTPTPLYFDAFPDSACVPGPCFCTTGTGNACKSVTCANFTTPNAPLLPTGFVGYTGYSDGSCATPSQVRGAPVGCSTYGGGSVGASCSATQLFFSWIPTSPSCSPTGVDLTCNIAAPTCGSTTNLACGLSAKNNCGPTSTTPATTTPATTSKPAAGAGMNVPSVLLALLVLAIIA